MRKLIVITLVVAAVCFAAKSSEASMTILYEPFDSASSISYSGGGSGFWGLSGNPSAPANPFTGNSGQFFIGRAVNSEGLLTVPNSALDVSGYQNFSMSVMLAGADSSGNNNGFEDDDYIKISLNGTVVEEFRGPAINSGNLKGTKDTSLEITNAFANYNFDIDSILASSSTAQLDIAVLTSVEYVGIDSVTINGYEISSNNVIPAPTSILLSGIGLSIVSWLRKRKEI